MFQTVRCPLQIENFPLRGIKKFKLTVTLRPLFASYKQQLTGRII